MFTNARERGLPQSSVALPDLAHASGLRERTSVRTTGSGCGSGPCYDQSRGPLVVTRLGPSDATKRATQVRCTPDESKDFAFLDASWVRIW